MDRDGAVGTCFAVGQTGCRLSDRGLHVEVRVAVQVRDEAAAEEYCEDRNHMALVGRWAYDPAHGVLSLVADLDLQGQPEYDVAAVAAEVTAELVSAVAWQQYQSAPQGLGGLPALPVLHGRLCDTSGPLAEHLVDHIYRRATGGTPPWAAMALARVFIASGCAGLNCLTYRTGSSRTRPTGPPAAGRGPAEVLAAKSR